jgi:Phage stabilisation protein
MKTPILGSSYVARSINAADNRMVNLFPEAIPEGGKEAGFLSRAPGLRLLTTVGSGPIRGLWTFSGFAYVVSGTQFYKLTSAYVSTLIGTVSGTGPVSMADNGTQLFVACNGPSYIYNSSTNVFAQITDEAFPGALIVGYIDGYFVFIEPNSQKLWVTSLLDGTTVDPLDFASAEGSPDGLVSMIVDHREVWLYGTNSVEVWYDAGLLDFPLQRIQGAFNEIGCAATYSVAKLDNGLFWLGADARGQGIVYRANGYTGVRISTHAIEYAIAQYGNISDAIAYTYQQEGHSFYVLTFPSANATWVYDVATQAWHERAGWENNQFTRHRSNCQMAFNSEIIVGDFENSNIYAFDLNLYADNGSIQKWLRSWRALATGQNTLKRTSQHTLQLDCEVGFFYGTSNTPAVLITENNLYLITESSELLSIETGITIPAAPNVMLRWSDDGGHTWSNENWRSMGTVGEYGYRTIWRRLGMTLKLRDRVYEISGTDPVKIAIMGAELYVTPTNA